MSAGDVSHCPVYCTGEQLEDQHLLTHQGWFRSRSCHSSRRRQRLLLLRQTQGQEATSSRGRGLRDHLAHYSCAK